MTEPSPPAKLRQQLGFRTLLGRVLLSATALVAVVLAVAWWSHVQVSNATASNTLRLSERFETSQQIRQISNTLWKIETQFQAYMLVPDENQRQQILTLSDELITDAKKLHQERWLVNTAGIQSAPEQFSDNMQRLKISLSDVMTIRADPMKVFPAMPIMVDELNPAYDEFNNLLDISLRESDQLGKNPYKKEITNHLYTLRHAWLSKVNTFRMLASSRVGIYLNTIESSIRDASYNIGIYNQIIQPTFAALQALDDKQALGFEQSLALETMQAIHTEWDKDYEKVREILLQEDGWRRDTPMIQKTITPLFSALWGAIRTMENEIEERAVQDIHSTSATADEVSSTLWLLVVVVIMMTVIVTVLFDTQIRRPIVRVARALKAEAEGEKEISLPDSHIAETNDLVTAFSHMREKVHSRQEHLQAVLTYAADGIITATQNGLIESFNPAAESLFSYVDTDIIGKPITTIVPEFDELRSTNDGSEIESYGLASTAEQFPIGINISQMQVGDRDLLLIMIADIRERQAMLEGIQAREQRLRSILDNTAEGIVTFDEQCQIENWNLAAEHLFGWKESEVSGAKFMQFIFSETNDELCEDMHSSSLSKFVNKDNEVVGRHKNGSHFPLSLKISRMTLEGSTKYTALIANISERKAMMENLHYLAEHDSLTHLHNRAFFNAELEDVVTRAAHDTKEYALLYIDLDNFKYINDTLGHAAGDKLLVEVATMLQKRARGSDIVARLGGDEFVVLLADANQLVIQNIAESYRNTLAEYDFHYDGRTVDVGCSIGIAMINQASTSPSETLAQADVACHLAKKAGRNRVHMFSNKDAGNVQTMSIDMGWSRRIRQSLEQDRFILAVQPIYNIGTLSVESYEILIRLRDDDDSIIMPSGFLPTADRFGLSADIDVWVIKHAIQHMAFLKENGIAVRYAINLSGQSMTAPQIAELIPRMIKETQIDPSSLTFEVTETTAISDIDIAISLLTRLRDLGCKTALDDFGSGMSSFAYLQELPVDIVKIDGRFVRNISASTVDQAMVRAMNEIAHALGKHTVAEFVENEHHLKTLSDIGVDYAQGYHLGKPVLIDEMTAKLMHERAQNSKTA